MTQPFQPYGQPPPHGAWQDPQAGSQVTAPSHTVPYVRLHGAPLVMVVAALVAAFAALAIVGIGFVRSGSATDVSHLRTQVTRLAHQHQRDETTIKGLATQVTTLNTEVSTLQAKVKGMGPTVANLAQFANGVCSQPLQGSKGPFTATFPCKTG